MSAVLFLCFLLGVLPPGSGFAARPQPGRWAAPLRQHHRAFHHPNSLLRCRTRRCSAKGESSKDEEPDLFDYFDPLLSPHSYPNGIEAEKENASSPTGTNGENGASSTPAPPLKEVEDGGAKEDYDPFQWSQTFSTKAGTKTSTRSRSGSKPFGIATPTAASSTAESKDPNSGADRPEVDPSTTFDPTLSPHVYANGVPDVVVGDPNSRYLDDDPTAPSQQTLGILLIDHGSKNEASNQRLEHLAALYQQSEPLNNQQRRAAATKVIVRACHMEIAAPSIQDGIASLLEDGVDEIVCHPYFLSPGRHVTQDIPELVEESIKALSVEIPVRTTGPVGSRTDVMIRAIHSLVEETSELYKQ